MVRPMLIVSVDSTSLVKWMDGQLATYLIPRMKEWALMTLPSQLKVTSASALFIWSSAILAIKVEVAMSILNEQWKENQQLVILPER